MKLAANIIYYRLAHVFSVRKESWVRSGGTYGAPRFLRDGHVVPGVVNVLDGGDLASAAFELAGADGGRSGKAGAGDGAQGEAGSGLPSANGEGSPSTCLLICLGDVIKADIPEGALVLSVHADCTLFDLFNAIQEIFQLFEEWDDAIGRAEHETEDYFDMLRACESVLYHPIALQDRDFRLAAYSDTARADGILDYVSNASGNLNPATAQRQASDRAYQQFTKNARAYRFKLIDVQGIAVNMKPDGEFVGWILINCPGDDVPLSLYYFDILNHLVKYANGLFRKLGYFEHVRAQTNYLAELFMGMARRNQTDGRQWVQALASCGWGREDDLLAMLIAAPHSIKNHVGMSYFQREFEHQWRGCICRELDDSCIALVNLSLFEAATANAPQSVPLSTEEPALQSTVDQFLRNMNLVAGISRPFRNSDDIPSAFKEATLAMRHIQAFWKEGDAMCQTFDAMALQYMIDHCCGDLPAHRICSERLSALARYDDENGTEYVATVKTYIESQLNAVATAKALCIQRSTLFYRFKRIRELTGISLSDSTEILYLYLSLQVLS